MTDIVKRSWWILIVLAILATACKPAGQRVFPPSAQRGVLDLTTWDLVRGGLVPLHGEWEYYPGQLLEPQDFKKGSPGQAHIVKLPLAWDDAILGTPGKENRGTLRLRIKAKSLDGIFGLRKVNIAADCRFWFDDVLVYAKGKELRATAVADRPFGSESTFFRHEEPTAQLLVQLTHFEHGQAGSLGGILLGTERQIHTARERQLSIDLLLFGSIFLMGLYHFGLYMSRKSDRSPLYFGLFCSIIALRVLFTNEYYIVTVMPDITWAFINRIEYLTFFLAGPTFFVFLRELYPQELPKRFIQASLGCAALFSAIVVLFPFKIYEKTLIPYDVITLVSAVFALVGIGLAVARRRDGAIAALVGSLLLFVTTVNDILTANQVINSTYLAHYGLLLFILSQSYLLAERFSRAFATVEALSQRLLSLDRLKNEFLANTSHELRTPLNGVIGIAESLIDGATGPLPDPTMRNLAMIVSSGKRLSSLVNDLLDFSKLKNRELILHRKPLDLRHLAEAVLMLSRPLVGNKPLVLINAIPDSLPMADGDEDRVIQIFHNLIGNAIKFTEKGEVKLTAAVENGLLVVTVADTGIGIPAEKQEDIFKSFEQVDASTAREYGGTGLGLSITRQLVELHGGRIMVESEPGLGSRFHFSLPIHTASMADPMETKLPPQPAIGTGDLTISAVVPAANEDTPHVLVVDDDLVNLQVLMNHLSLNNYRVLQATNGPEALGILEREHVDMVLLDIMMPKMSGFEVCERIRLKHPAAELPVLLLTAKDQEMDVVAGFAAGANDYLSKPVSKAQLLSRLKTHLRLARFHVATSRFVPHELMRILNKQSIVEVKLGDQVQKKMSVLFSDIRSFTTLSEQMTPQENFNFINSYLTTMGPVIREHAGFIDKYIGDAIMALFDTRADDALQAGIGMKMKLVDYNAGRVRAGYMPIEIGIGVNTGELMLGTVGEQNRMEGTVISDSVNLASRIEGLTKAYGIPLLISQYTLDSLQDPGQFKIRFIDRVNVKGKAEAVSIYEVIDGDARELLHGKLSTLQTFQEALSLFRNEQTEAALHLFQACLDHVPGDTVAEVYIKRCHARQLSVT